MQPVPESPDDAIAQLKSGFLEYRIQQDVEGIYLTFLNIVPDLPADRAAWMQEADCFRNSRPLGVHVSIKRTGCFVRLAEIVGRGSYNEFHAAGWQGPHEGQVVLANYNGV